MVRSIKLLTVGIIVMLTISSCFLQSVHPLVSHNDSKLVDGLEGVWGEKNSKWYFINDMNNFRIFMGSDDNPYPDDSPAQGGRGSYYVFHETVSEGKRDTTMYVGSTIELNGDHYLDLFPYQAPEDEGLRGGMEYYSLFNNHFFPVHTFSKINIEDDSLKIELFDDQWIREQIINNRIRLKHEFIGEANQKVLITASTEELQQFVLKYGDEEHAYEEPRALKRIQ